MQALKQHEVIKARPRQAPLWSTPPAAALGETLERLAIWSQAARWRRFELRFAGLKEPRYWVDVRQRNKVVASFDAESPAELAKLVTDWLNSQLAVTP